MLKQLGNSIRKAGPAIRWAATVLIREAVSGARSAVLSRMSPWIGAALALLGVVIAIAPHQISIIAYKLCLSTLGAVAGYWIDRSLFPYARPHRFWRDQGPPMAGIDLVFAACQIRRAMVVAALVIGVNVGL